MKYYADIGFGQFGWADGDIGIFGGQRSGGFQKAGQHRGRFFLYDTAHKKAEGTDKMVGSVELIVRVPNDENDPYEIIELVNLEIAKDCRKQGYGRRAVEAIMRAAPDDILVADIKKTKLRFWTKVGVEDVFTRGSVIYGHIRKQHEPAPSRSIALAM
jgi:GNAT superfamily N-acetyltransferase